ncbi:MAG: hypothetical protein J0M24_20610 [Verrucomicrobia bacterium]|nr:hypothetical protein [Verrucomicrobiota bacterium]
MSTPKKVEEPSGLIPGKQVEVSGEGTGVIVAAPDVPQGDLVPEYVVDLKKKKKTKAVPQRDLNSDTAPPVAPTPPAGRTHE